MIKLWVTWIIQKILKMGKRLRKLYHTGLYLMLIGGAGLMLKLMYNLSLYGILFTHERSAVERWLDFVLGAIFTVGVLVLLYCLRYVFIHLFDKNSPNYMEQCNQSVAYINATQNCSILQETASEQKKAHYVLGTLPTGYVLMSFKYDMYKHRWTLIESKERTALKDMACEIMTHLQ